LYWVRVERWEVLEREMWKGILGGLRGERGGGIVVKKERRETICFETAIGGIEELK
jgi:hypothetical protein